MRCRTRLGAGYKAQLPVCLNRNHRPVGQVLHDIEDLVITTIPLCFLQGRAALNEVYYVINAKRSSPHVSLSPGFVRRSGQFALPSLRRRVRIGVGWIACGST